jgi:NitT/TauT family transport system substrate-binding protein
MKSVELGVIALLATLAVLSSCANPTPTLRASVTPSSRDSKMTIMVGGIDKIIYLVPTLTKQLGYFEEQGLDVDLLDQPAGVNTEDALLKGQVDGGVGFYDHTLDLQGRGKKVESVMILNWVPGEAVLVSTKLADQIKSPADFKGRNLGVTSIGSSTHFLTLYFAVKNGLKVEDIHSIPVTAGNTFITAMRKGQIDAGMTTEPTISRLLKSGDAKILIDMRTAEGAKAALGGTYPGSCLYMQTEWVNNHKDQVQKMVNALVKTLKWIHTHTPEEIAAKMPQDFYMGDKDLYVTALKGSMGIFSPDGKMPPDGPQTVLNVHSIFNKNVQGKQIDLSATYTNEFVNQAR